MHVIFEEQKEEHSTLVMNIQLALSFEMIRFVVRSSGDFQIIHVNLKYKTLL